MKTILECLYLFCGLLGQKVSLHKSSIMFSKGVGEAMALKISDLSKIPITNNLDKYLGTPSITGRVQEGFFQHMMERIEGKLDGWKSKLLTLAGRTTLAKAVLNSIPIYTMQTTLLPISACT